MSQLNHNLNLSLKIAEYFLEPAILIISHKYDQLNNLIIITDNDFTNAQINYYIEYLYHKFTIEYFIEDMKKKNETILCRLMLETLNLNIFMKTVNHQIYIKNNYLKQFLPNTLLSYNILNTENNLSFLTSKLNKNKFYNIKNLEISFNIIILKTQVNNLQTIMRYWGIYFSQYLELIDNDLQQFTVHGLLSFINEEELMMYDLLSEDDESDNDL